tara:strand:- start:145 stop:1452 length:1308 start_codon:yes stop_codon:yes gene_type:complete
MKLKKIKKLLENQINLLTEQEGCNESIHLCFELLTNMGTFTVCASYTIQEIINYLNNNDSGNDSTQIMVTQGGTSFPFNLPIDFGGISTADYGVSNVNDLLSSVINTSDINNFNQNLPYLDEVSATIFWSSSPMGNSINPLAPQDVLAMIKDCGGGDDNTEQAIPEFYDLIACNDECLGQDLIGIPSGEEGLDQAYQEGILTTIGGISSQQIGFGGGMGCCYQVVASNATEPGSNIMWTWGPDDVFAMAGSWENIANPGPNVYLTTCCENCPTGLGCPDSDEGCESLINQPEHLGCCSKCENPNFNPEEDPTCAPHCECCGDEHIRYTCSQGGECISGPNLDYPFESLEACEETCGQQIICYRCQNGNTVANQFPGPNCPQQGGWSSNPNPCSPSDTDNPFNTDIGNVQKQKLKPLRELFVKRLQKLAGIKKSKK